MRVGLIGLGMVAQTHVAALRAAGLTLSCVMGRNAAKTRAFAGHVGAEAVFDVNAIAEQSDFVILVTPPDARAAYVTALAERGIPILSEKPLERDLPRAKALVELCETAGMPLGVTLQHRMRPAAIELLGRLRALGAVASVDLRVPWWREQSYYDAPGRGTFARDGGGVLITQAVHAMDLMLQCCGPVEAVQAMVATTPLHQLEAEDFAAAALRFRSGAVGALMASVTHRPGGTESLAINATGGSARLEGNVLTLHWADGRTETFGEGGATGGGADPMAFNHGWHQAVITDFADALREGRAPVITGRSALPAQALVDAIQRSACDGCRVGVENV